MERATQPRNAHRAPCNVIIIIIIIITIIIILIIVMRAHLHGAHRDLERAAVVGARRRSRRELVRRGHSIRDLNELVTEDSSGSAAPKLMGISGGREEGVKDPAASTGTNKLTNKRGTATHGFTGSLPRHLGYGAVSSDSGLVVSRGRPAVSCWSLISLCFVTEVFSPAPCRCAGFVFPHNTHIHIHI